ncbi:MAG: hypothetical protein M1826_005129 [Phylliscum demangeonii]|nr:MAG: hypothetical protein M1826_005129 [Phylliscum demangeonii]
MAAFSTLLLSTALVVFCLRGSLPSWVFASPLPSGAARAEAADIPDYVSRYGTSHVPMQPPPKVWLHSTEAYLPADWAAQLLHTTPQVNYAPLPRAPTGLTLDDLDRFNGLAPDPKTIYLTAVDDVSKQPGWLHGVAPNATTGQTQGVTSCVIVVTDHGQGSVDAFYFYFYAFNQGNAILGSEIGDHVGDIEHNMIRFQDGRPQVVWYSQHSNGEAFIYDVVEKDGQRPITYSAKGSHANYATAGPHDHSIPDLNLPFGPVQDRCDRGRLWDPLLAAYAYRYQPASQTFVPGPGYNPLGLVLYRGRWGDQQYPDADPRQHKIFDLAFTAKYVDGPTGPIDKQLDRKEVCPVNGLPCIIRDLLGA